MLIVLLYFQKVYPYFNRLCWDMGTMSHSVMMAAKSRLWVKGVSVSIQSTFVTASVAQLDVPSDWRPGGHGFNPRRGRQHSFVEIDREIFSTVILSLPLIQEGQLSVSGKRMCTILVNH